MSSILRFTLLALPICSFASPANVRRSQRLAAHPIEAAAAAPTSTTVVVQPTSTSGKDHVAFRGVTYNGRCGSAFGTTCHGSQWGSCCSQHGWCGGGAQYCAVDKCLSEWGDCELPEILPEEITTPEPAPTEPASDTRCYASFKKPSYCVVMPTFPAKGASGAACEAASAQCFANASECVKMLSARVKAKIEIDPGSIEICQGMYKVCQRENLACTASVAAPLTAPLRKEQKVLRAGPPGRIVDR